MNVNFQIDIDPSAGGVIRELERDLQQIETALVKEISESAPEEMRNLMVSANPDGKTSSIGNPPAKKSGKLFDSLQGKVLSADSASVEMAGHAVYLDPFLGGKLNRPFIIEGIDRAITKTLRSL